MFFLILLLSASAVIAWSAFFKVKRLEDEVKQLKRKVEGVQEKPSRQSSDAIIGTPKPPIVPKPAPVSSSTLKATAATFKVASKSQSKSWSHIEEKLGGAQLCDIGVCGAHDVCIGDLRLTS